MEKTKNSYNILVEKPEGKTRYGGPRNRWEDNIRMDLRKGGWEDSNESGSVQGPVAGPCEL
jgi:hypothetical protein